MFLISVLLTYGNEQKHNLPAAVDDILGRGTLSEAAAVRGKLCVVRGKGGALRGMFMVVGC